MKNKDKISLIIPLYNVEEYLEECLNSIVNQDYGLENIEVIMIDDASTDKTLKIAEKYHHKYGFILLKNNKNSGQAISRNKGIQKATGKYIAFLDSDDLLYENNLSTLYNEIIKNDADIAMARLNSFNSKGEYGYYSNKYINVQKITNVYESQDLLNCISVCSKIYKTSMIKKIKFLPNTFHEDNSFTLISLFLAKKIAIYPHYLYYRRIREGENKSTMQKLNYKTFNDLILNYKECLNKIKPINDIYFLYKWMVKKLNNYLVMNVKKSEIKKGKEDIKKFILEIDTSETYKKSLYKFNNYYYLLAKTYSIIKK